VSLQLRVGDHVTDLYRSPVTVAIRYGVPEDSALVALPLAPDNRRVLCASPAYLSRFGRPETPSDLARHNCLRLALSDRFHDRWTFFKDDEPTVVGIRGDRCSDDGDLVRRWALAGLGVAYKSRLDVIQDIRAGKLETVLDSYRGELAPLHMVCAHRTMLSPTVSALREFLRDQFLAHGS
jgi:DNA-binding transcriptional LysR family regulator